MPGRVLRLYKEFFRQIKMGLPGNKAKTVRIQDIRKVSDLFSGSSILICGALSEECRIWLHAPEYFFIQQAGKEPDRRIVKAYHTVNVPSCLTVVPGAHIAFFQQTSGDEFSKENGAGIDAPPKKRPFLLNPAGDGSQESGHSVDGKHPDGGTAFQLHLSPLEGFEACPEDFQAPADESAEDKFVLHRDSMRRNAGRNSIEIT